ncbi:SgcJ/EcaC family oxidoreductase [Nocardia sp. JCM 34519]|nr:nuclear transport factor 2 family protein [Nocardia sp. JCM 34519]
MTINSPAELLTRYERAFNDNDAAAMNALFTEACTFVNFSGKLVDGRAELLAAQKFVFDDGGPLTGVSVSYEPVKTIELSASLVQIVARQRTRGHIGPEPDPMHGIIILTARRDHADWRIHVGQNTPVLAVA